MKRKLGFVWCGLEGLHRIVIPLGTRPQPLEYGVLEIAALGEAGLRALGFWLFLFSPTYRAQVVEDWRSAGTGRRIAIGLEGLLGIVLGLGAPLLGVWLLLRP